MFRVAPRCLRINRKLPVQHLSPIFHLSRPCIALPLETRRALVCWQRPQRSPLFPVWPRLFSVFSSTVEQASSARLYATAKPGAFTPTSFSPRNTPSSLFGFSLLPVLSATSRHPQPPPRSLPFSRLALPERLWAAMSRKPVAY